MKITAALLISGAMMLSLCACGGTAEPDPVQPTETPAQPERLVRCVVSG